MASVPSHYVAMFFTGLVCGLCGKWHSKDLLQTVCQDCGRPLLAQYDLSAASAALNKEKLPGREASLWRYREMLPLPLDTDPITLGEGWTPLLPAPLFGEKIGLPHLWIKDESQNPTGSFKARGMAVAVSMARQFGLKALALASAGNAAGALSAYAARAKIAAHIFMPKETPKTNIVECVATGAHVTLIDGLITDCGKEVTKRKGKEGWFDVSTLKEPFRIEGKKTLGCELAEQLHWILPDVVVYPTGGGTGLIGMWKAFSEMEQMGWISPKRPRMVSVQAAGCCPIVTAFETNKRFAEEHPNASTKAAGIRVPKALGDFLILDAIRASGGTAVSVTDEEIFEIIPETGATEGIFFSPEGAACCAALKKLKASGWIRPEETIVIFNTAAGAKNIEGFADFGSISPS
jgi:threonine synthase